MSSTAPTFLPQLDHVTVIVPELEPLRDFLCDVAGLVDGPRPPFRSIGRWLHAGGRPAVHLVQRAMPAVSGPRASCIDHFALRMGNGADWRELIRRLDERGIPFVQRDVPASNERQLFVTLAPGLQVEFVMSDGLT